MTLPHIIRVARDPNRKGCSDEWTATLESDPVARKGIGRNTTEAIGCLVGANLNLFRIEEIKNIDPGRDRPTIVWKFGQGDGKIGGQSANLVVFDEANGVAKP